MKEDTVNFHIHRDHPLYGYMLYMFFKHEMEKIEAKHNIGIEKLKK